VAVRLLVQDDPAQCVRAERAFRRAVGAFFSATVLPSGRSGPAALAMVDVLWFTPWWTPAPDPTVLRETTVARVEPITFPAGLSTRTEGGRTLMGTKLFVQAPDGVSAEKMALILRCHSAKALVGQVDPLALAGDPFYLPDTWMDIDVKAEPGFLVVRLSADRIWQNLRVLHRAIAFADAHHPVLQRPAEGF
jgi:hypothetical protein